MRFVTSDTHFGHANIIKYCDRPYKDRHHMNEALIENWNNVIGDGDVVYHLGDVAMGPSDEWDAVLKRLNGYKVLVIGNHDKVFEGAYKPSYIEKWEPRYEEWFDEIYPHLEGIEFAGITVNMSHFPYEADHMETRRYMEHRLKDEGVPLIHGHTHDRGVPVSYSEAGTLQIHAGQDAWNYTPVSEDQIEALLRGL